MLQKVEDPDKCHWDSADLQVLISLTVTAPKSDVMTRVKESLWKMKEDS